MTDIKTTIANEVHGLKKSFRHEPHSLSKVRASLEIDKGAEVNFVELLEKHHDYIKESIVILTDNLATLPEKQSNLDRFLHLLNMHAKAEEETLYEVLVRNNSKETRLVGISGKEEHDHAFQISKELQSLNYKVHWTDEIEAKAKVIATFLSNHIKEEEAVMFHLAKKNISEQEMKKLSELYLVKCSTYINEILDAPRKSESGVLYH
jgi:hemerythrin-like domain-containing protein